MNFNEFVNEVKDNIKLFLPRDYENAEVSTMECQKLNRAYTGLMVRKEGEMLILWILEYTRFRASIIRGRSTLIINQAGRALLSPKQR